MEKPPKPDHLNGEHGHLWELSMYLSQRIDDTNKKVDRWGAGIISGVVALLVLLLAQL